MNEQASPFGATVSDHIEESLEDSDFRAEYERLRPYEELARMVLRRRAALGLSQADLATRMGVATEPRAASMPPTSGPSRSSEKPSASELSSDSSPGLRRL
jgi:hypothetical protein